MTSFPFSKISARLGLFLALVCLPSQADFEGTRTFVQGLLDRISSSGALSGNPTRYELVLHLNWQAPQITEEQGKVGVNLSALWALRTERNLLAVLTNTVTRNDTLSFQILADLGEDPASLADALESMPAWQKPGFFLENAAHFPMGVHPFEVEGVLETGALRGSLYAPRSTDSVRRAFIEFRKIREDTNERLPTSFPRRDSYPDAVEKELKKLPAEALTPALDAELFKSRSLGPGKRLEALLQYTMQASASGDGKTQAQAFDTACAELAQILRLLTEGDSRKETNVKRVAEVQSALRLFDYLHFGAFEEVGGASRSRTSKKLLLWEALRAARLFTKSLPLDGRTPTSKLMQDWYSTVTSPPSDFLTNPSGFLSLVVLANPRLYQSLLPTDLSLLYESPFDQENQFLRSGLYFELFNREFGSVGELSEAAFFSVNLRPAFEQLDAIAKLAERLPFWRLYSHRSDLNIKAFAQIKRTAKGTTAQENVPNSFSGVSLPNLEKTPTYSEYLRNEEFFPTSEWKPDAGWKWESVARSVAQEYGADFELRNYVLFVDDVIPENSRATIFNPTQQPVDSALAIMQLSFKKLSPDQILNSEKIRSLFGDSGLNYIHVSFLIDSIRSSCSRKDWENYAERSKTKILLRLQKELFAVNVRLSPVDVALHLVEMKAAADRDFQTPNVISRSLIESSLELLSEISAGTKRKADAADIEKAFEFTYPTPSVERLNKSRSFSQSGAWLLAAHFWKSKIYYLIPSQELAKPDSETNLKIRALQAHILEDTQTAETITEFRHRALALFLLNPESDLASQSITDLLEAAKRETPTLSFGHISALLEDFSHAGLAIRLSDLERLTSFLMGQILVEVHFSNNRQAVLAARLAEIQKSFSGSAYYSLLDAKLDRLAEDIKATREEARLIKSIKTFASDPIDYLSQRERDADDPAAGILSLLDLAVKSMGLRTTQENSQLRNFLFSRNLTGSEELQVVQRLASDILALGPRVDIQIDADLAGLSDSERAEFVRKILVPRVARFREDFRMLRPADRLIAGSLFLTAQSSDGRLIDSTWFRKQAISDFFSTKGELSESDPYHVLAEELLLAFDPPDRALLITQAQLRNEVILDSSGNLAEIRAERIVALLSALGPYGFKFAQLLARIPGIDPVLAEKCRRLEDNADRPDYYDLYLSLDNHLTEKEVLDNPRIVGVRAGSMKITLFVEFHPKRGKPYEKAFSIRRENVRRAIERVHAPVKIALERAYQRVQLPIMRAFLSLPDDARSMLEGEMDFEREFAGFRLAAEDYAAIRTDRERRIQVLELERLSVISEREQAIVSAFLDAGRLDQLTETNQAELLEPFFRLEIRLFLVDGQRHLSNEFPGGRVSLETDRHLGNLLVLKDKTGHTVRHIDMGQWSGFPVAHRDLFARLLAALALDLRGEGFSSFEASLRESFGVDTLDSDWWQNLKADLESLRVSAQKGSFSSVLTGMLFFRESVRDTEKNLGASFFRFVKFFETLSGVAHQLNQNDLFLRVIAEELAAVMGMGREDLLRDPLPGFHRHFSKSTRLNPKVLTCRERLLN